MTPGTLLCGRFRVLAVLEARSDREVFEAVDTVTRHVVTLHRGGRDLAREVERIQTCAGRGLQPVLGLWRDGMDVVVVLRRRPPERTLADTEPVSPERALGWIADVAEGLARLHAAGVVHGHVRAERVAVVGGRAVLDPTGPWPEAGRRTHDILDLARLLHACVRPERVGRVRRPVRALLRQLDPEVPDAVPRSAGAVRVACERALRRRRPGPLTSVAVAPRRAAVVLGREGDGPWSHASAPLSVRRARRLAEQCAQAGWEVQVVRRALSWTDLLVIAVAAAVVGVVIPVVGIAVGGLLMARRRARGCSPHAGSDLPALAAPMPTGRGHG